MGSSNFNIDQADSVAINGSFGNRSGEIDSRSNDVMLLVVEFDAGAGVTAVELRPVVEFADGEFAPIYRHGDSGMIADTISIPVSAGQAGQFAAVRVDTRGVRSFRLDGRVVGGTTGAIASVRASRDGSVTKTPHYSEG
jgi:hypothetical protein